MTQKITRRTAIASAAAPLVAALAQSAEAQTTKPNIVYIMADDLGYADVSCYGRREYKTPAIDSIATGGTRFLQAYANSAVCSATRTALITGRYQYRLPVGLAEPLTVGPNAPGLPADHPTLPSILRAAGYGTTLLGKWHLGNLPNYSPLKSGYDHFWGFKDGGLDYFSHKLNPAADGVTDGLWDGDARIQEQGYLTELIGNRAVQIVRDYATERKPFLLSLHFNAPHWPWEGPNDQEESRRLGGLNSVADYDGGTMATYAEMVTAMDAQIARVLQTLEQTGIAQNTIVIFTSDNGGERFADRWPFTGMKEDLLEGGLRIPAIIRWPGRIPAGVTTEQVGISMDWMPTLLAAAGTQPDPMYPSDGMNLLPILTEQAPNVTRTLFWRYNNKAQRAVRSGDLKFLKIRDNTFLFNVAKDQLERANLKNRQPEDYTRLVQAFEEWNAQMLPETPRPNAGTSGATMADHFGGGGPAPAPAKPKPQQ
ncbi:MAG: sulfatase-like hydrolase/transferase [Bryobacteraceae bacterium]